MTSATNKKTQPSKPRWIRRIFVSSAVLAVLLALLVGSFRLAFVVFPDLKTEVENRISAQASYDIRFEKIDLGWRQRWPSLALEGVSVNPQSDQQANTTTAQSEILNLERVDVAFSKRGLIRGEFLPVLLYLRGLAVTLQITDNGLVLGNLNKPPAPEQAVQDTPKHSEEQNTPDLASPSSSPAQDAEDHGQALLKRFVQLGRLQLESSELRIIDPRQPEVFRRFSEVELALTSEHDQHHLVLSAQLPAVTGGRLALKAQASGRLDDWQAMQGDAVAEVSGIDIQSLIQPYLRPGVKLSVINPQVTLNTRFADGSLLPSDVDISTGPVQAQQADGQAVGLWQSVNAQAQISAVAARGWQMQLSRLAIQPVGKSAVWATKGQGRWLHTVTESSAQEAVSANRVLTLDNIDLAVLVPLLASLDSGGFDPVAANMKGLIRDFSITANDASESADWRLSGKLQNFSMKPQNGLPGVSELSGAWQTGPQQGHIDLVVGRTGIDIPDVFRQPLPVEHIKGRIGWSLKDKGWFIDAPKLSYAGPGQTQASGGFSLDLARNLDSPYIDLDFNFKSEDIRPLKPAIPYNEDVLGLEVSEWLTASLLGGRVPSGRVQLKGKLVDFPYENEDEPGLFKVDFQVRDGLLEYVEGWPRISEIDGRLVFKGRSMQIDAKHGRTVGEPIHDVKVGIRDYHESILTVHGKVDGDAGRMLAFLPQSPLREDFAGLTSNLELAGPAKLDLKLNIPLDNVDATTVFGIINLYQAEVGHELLPGRVQQVNGRLDFDVNGIRAKDISAELGNLPVKISLSPHVPAEGPKSSAGVTSDIDLKIDTQLQLPEQQDLLAAWMPLGLLNNMQGESEAEIRVLLDDDAGFKALRVHTDLYGMALNLPAPFGKQVKDYQPLTLLLTPEMSTTMRGRFQYGEVLAVALRLIEQGPGYALERGLVKLGDKQVELPREKGLWIEGRIARSNLDDWTRMMVSESESAKPATETNNNLARQLRGAELVFDELRGFGQTLRDLRLTLNRLPDHWLLSASGPNIEGDIEWPLAPRGVARADIRHLELVRPSEDLLESNGEPADPSTWPGLELNCRRLIMNGEELGALKISARPIDHGLRMTKLRIDGPKTAAIPLPLSITGNGQWVRNKGQSSARLTLNGETTQIKSLFTALAYEPTIESRWAKLESQLEWATNGSGLKAESLNGELGFQMKNGALLTVNPGAGRVLGLMNFSALPKRLQLDFSDVTDQGLAFDNLRGNFDIRNGDAWTENLKIDGPAADMRIRGRIGIAARDYDQQVEVIPKLSTSVTLAGTVLGGPAVGAGLLVLQRLLKKPIESLANISYRITGSWDEPEIGGLKADEAAASDEDPDDKDDMEADEADDQPMSEPVSQPESGRL